MNSIFKRVHMYEGIDTWLVTYTWTVGCARELVRIGLPPSVRVLEKAPIDVPLSIGQVPGIVGAPRRCLAVLLAACHCQDVRHRAEVVVIIASVKVKAFCGRWGLYC